MMKEQQKEAALLAQQQQMASMGADFAQRGAVGDGAYGAAMRRLQLGTQGNILDQYRNIDIAAAQQGAQDRLGALGAADAYQTGVMNRGVSGYGAGLQGQQAQAGENYRGFQSQSDAVNFALQRALQQEQLYQAEAASGQQAYGLGQNADQWRYNYGLDSAKLGLQGQQQLMDFIRTILGGGGY
jgi:hypothetical protein